MPQSWSKQISYSIICLFFLCIFVLSLTFIFNNNLHATTKGDLSIFSETKKDPFEKKFETNYIDMKQMNEKGYIIFIDLNSNKRIFLPFHRILRIERKIKKKS